MKFSAQSDIGQVRELNEDSYIVFEAGGHGYMVVADGMGGHNAGEVASLCTVNIIKDYICENPHGDVAELMKASIREANDFVYAKSRSDEQYSYMGTTVVLCSVRKGAVYFANVGDSRGYLINEMGIRQVTDDDSIVSQLVKNGEITPEEAKSHPQRNVITKAVGTEEDIEPALYRASCKPGDIAVLCSDGLTEFVDDEEICSIIKEYGTDEGVSLLMKLANDRGGYDNITVAAAVVGEVNEG